MGDVRVERDALGEYLVPIDALYGVHSMRAKENFPYHKPFHIEWYKALGMVKMAAYQTYRSLVNGVNEKYGNWPDFMRLIAPTKLNLLEEAALRISRGEMFDSFIVSALQGGAGTSINMNVNEIIANCALLKMGSNLGNYDLINPIDDANIFQSTNDVIPTSLRVATLFLLRDLEEAVNTHRSKIEEVESRYRNVLRQGYTQMQAAVPSSYDKLFSGYNNALSRDWWRVSKCFERIKEVNLGGGAVGTGLAIPRFYIMNAVSNLQKITSLPITRGENMSDTTANLDSFVEVHAILKASAVNLEKMASDLRLMASDLFANREVKLPAKQVGSSIMPSKINPVIVEYVVSGAHRVYANDELITRLSALGCLDLNAYLPSIGDALLDSLKTLISMHQTMANNLWSGFEVDVESSREQLLNSPTITTALVGQIGYNTATQLAKYMVENHCSVFEANLSLGLLNVADIEQALEPARLLSLGFTFEWMNKK